MFQILPRTFTVYVTACDVEKSFDFDNIVGITFPCAFLFPYLFVPLKYITHFLISYTFISLVDLAPNLHLFLLNLSLILLYSLFIFIPE